MEAASFKKNCVTTQPVYTESYRGKHGSLRPRFCKHVKFYLQYFLGPTIVLGC